MFNTLIFILVVGVLGGGKEMPLTAVIETPAGQTDVRTFQIRLRVTNPVSSKIAIVNPDMGVPSPALKWPWSKEAYQTSLLISYGLLEMSVTDAAGKVLPREAIQTWSTPVLRPKLELGPGDSLDVVIPLGTFYQLQPGRKYRVSLQFGDKDLKVEASTTLSVP